MTDTSILSGPSGTVRSTTASFGFTAQEAGSRFQCSLNGAAFSACSSPKSYPNLASKQHTFRVRAADAAGKVDASPARLTWTVDAVRPRVAPLSPKPGSTVRDRTPTVRATARDSQTNLAKSNVRLFVDGRRVTTFSYDRANDRLTYTGHKLSFGGHNAKVVARDDAGNVTSRAWRFRVAR